MSETPEETLRRALIRDQATRLIQQGQTLALASVVRALALRAGHPEIAELCGKESFRVLTKNVLQKPLIGIGDKQPAVAREVFRLLEKQDFAPNDPDNLFGE